MIVAQVTSAREWVESYFTTDGKKCAECNFCHTWKEAHGETLSECRALEGDATECPALPEPCPECGGYAVKATHYAPDECAAGCDTSVKHCSDCGQE